MSYDLIIRGGTIVDGTGKPAWRGDIATLDGRISAVGQIHGHADRHIDATGAIITPGFVDIHTHFDGQACWDNRLAPSSVNGVTTGLCGNCGVGFAPARPDKHDWLIQLLEGVEDIPGTALAEGLTWEWESFPEYLQAMNHRRWSLDLGFMMPHAALRAYVMGDRGGNHEERPSPAEIGEMEELTFEALKAGAIGFSTSRTYVHRSANGSNIGTLTASHEELLGIATAFKRAGTGVIQLISDAYLTPDDAFAHAELDLIRKLASHSGRPVSFTLQQTDDAPDRWRMIFDQVEQMNRDGLDVKCQVAPRAIGTVLSFASTSNPFMFTPAWRELAARTTVEERIGELARPDVKQRILAEHAAMQLDGLAGTMSRAFHRLFRMADPVDYEPHPTESIGAEAEDMSCDTASYTYDMLLRENGRQLLYMPLINYARGNLDDVFGMMSGKHVLFGLSDAGAHCGTICDASFPTTTLALWAKGNRAGHKFSLEELVHGLTQRNARHVGWYDRGVIAPGYWADFNIIDMDELALPPPELTQDLPAGGTRLTQAAHGFRYTIKNSLIVHDHGKFTGKATGNLIRGETKPMSMRGEERSQLEEVDI